MYTFQWTVCSIAIRAKIVETANAILGSRRWALGFGLWALAKTFGLTSVVGRNQLGQVVCE